MIDYHCHLLPGLDDGAASWDDSLRMARALARFGFREVCCTPHCIKGHYEISPVEVRDAVRHLQARLDGEGLALTLRPGMEYYLDEFFEQFAANLLPLGDSRVVLCEAPPQAPPELVCEMVTLIVIQGYIPLIAHPERSEVIWQLIEAPPCASGTTGQGDGFGHARANGESREPAAVGQEGDGGGWWRRLAPRSAGPLASDASRAAGRAPRFSGRTPALASAPLELPDACLFQASLGSFTGFYGPKPQRRAYELLQRGVYHCLASDLHDAHSASEFLEEAHDKLTFNPALKRLGAFVAPQGGGGNNQLAFW